MRLISLRRGLRDTKEASGLPMTWPRASPSITTTAFCWSKASRSQPGSTGKRQQRSMNPGRRGSLGYHLWRLVSIVLLRNICILSALVCKGKASARNSQNHYKVDYCAKGFTQTVSFCPLSTIEANAPFSWCPLVSGTCSNEVQ